MHVMARSAKKECCDAEDAADAEACVVGFSEERRHGGVVVFLLMIALLFLLLALFLLCPPYSVLSVSNE